MPIKDYAVYAVFCDHQATGLPGDVAFYGEPARQVGSPVLELGCGTGRILLPMAEAGLEVSRTPGRAARRSSAWASSRLRRAAIASWYGIRASTIWSDR